MADVMCVKHRDCLYPADLANMTASQCDESVMRSIYASGFGDVECRDMRRKVEPMACGEFRAFYDTIQK